MILQPVLHPILLVVIFVPLLVVTVGAIFGWRPFANKQPRVRTERWPWITRTVLVLACLVMLLRPGIPGGSSDTLATDVDIVIAVDTTASVVAEDWNGSEPRLTGIRQDVQQIVERYPGARFSLVSFDASAQLRLPMTTDATALVSALDILTPEVTVQSRGSSIGIAHTLVAQVLQQAAEVQGTRARMVFYFGDGEQTNGSEPESFADSAALVDGGMVFGYGTAEGGPMKITSGAFETESGYIEYQGQQAKSVIDEAALQTIASELGIGYQHRAAGEELQLPDAPVSTTTLTNSGSVGNVIELYWIAAALATAMLAVEAFRAAFALARMRGLVERGGDA